MTTMLAEKELYEVILENTKLVNGERVFTGKKKELAEKVDKSVRTITRLLNKLETYQSITKSARKGRHGGTVIMVHDWSDVPKESHPDNAYTGTSKKAKALRDKMFPNKGTYKPDNLTPEERIRRKKLREQKNNENEVMNLELQELEYPTKSFFQRTSEPELNYKAYLLGRIYEALLVSYPEQWRNEAESVGDEEGFKQATKWLGKFSCYTVIKKEFMGTISHEHFKKLSVFLDQNNISPMDYLQPQFEHLDFLIRSGNSRATPPYINTLLTDKAKQRYYDSLEWKRNFDREHPYYARVGKVRSKLINIYPIITVLNSEYRKPLTDKKDHEFLLDYKKDQLFGAFLQQRQLDYYYQTTEAINNQKNLTDGEKQALTQLLEHHIVSYMGGGYCESQFLLYFPNQISTFYGAELTEDEFFDSLEVNMRRIYGKLGAVHTVLPQTANNNRNNIKRGYRLHFSITGHRMFLNTMRMIKDINGLEPNKDDLMNGLKKLDIEQPFKFDKYNFLDFSFLKEAMTQEELEFDAKLRNDEGINEERKIYLENEIDKPFKLWYDIYVYDYDDTKRDGTKVVINQPESAYAYL